MYYFIRAIFASMNRRLVSSQPSAIVNALVHRESFRCGVAVVIMLLTISAAPARNELHQPPFRDLTFLPYSKPGGRVDIGGRRIDFRCSGEGGPTVIFMAGLGSFSVTWRKVQSVIARRVRTCAFDTAGFGYSDPAPKPQTLSDVANDLHAGLAALKINGPYVLVAHSIAGIEARLFALRWPDEVAGMVLVDSSFAGQGLVQAKLPGYDWESQVGEDVACIARLAGGHLRAADPDYAQCVDLPSSDTPPELASIWPNFSTTAGAIATVSLALSLVTPYYDEADALDLGKKPLVVLTAGKPEQAYRQAFYAIWLERHERFAHMSLNGDHRIIAGARHAIQEDKPDVVIQAVSDVLDSLTANEPLKDRQP